MNQSKPSPRILYADDNEGHRRLIQIVLDRMGWEHRMASNGREAVELADRESFDLILMDLRMPQLDGFQAARQLRQRGITVPALALTALDYPGLASDCRAAGYDGCLVKPVTPRCLEEAVESYLAAGPSQ